MASFCLRMSFLLSICPPFLPAPDFLPSLALLFSHSTPLRDHLYVLPGVWVRDRAGNCRILILWAWESSRNEGQETNNESSKCYEIGNGAPGRASLGIDIILTLRPRGGARIKPVR